MENKQIIDGKVLVGTHHKTGSVWMRKVFFRIAKKLDFVYYGGSQDSLPKNNFDIFFDDHSRFKLDLLPPYRGLHLIRDPRDIIISGCFYHQKADEKWLHTKRKEFGGLTYQEKINSYSSIDEQIFFEMEHTAAITINDIRKWDYNNSNFIEIKYENLIEDNNLILFEQIFTFLGFPERFISTILEIAYQNSIFSGQVKKSLHVRSGKKNQWEEFFKDKHKKRFIELFGDTLIKLGYK
ncbi:sulfotransferase domain-containing protein [Dapis sp. BLCC M172]|uniref:sulfotransferase domain-containing protein n=1 Tax=Dapis sp. BLCC M172 TaxID=2975281 RepID=UPI003CEC84F2